MPNRTLKYFAAVAAIVATPALANAQIVAYSTSSSPVAITAVSVNAAYAPASLGGEAADAPQFIAQLDSGYITLSFVNKSDAPVTAVTFLVSNGHDVHSIVDKGMFSPGVQVKHTFPIADALSEFSDATCEVAQVDYADRGAWHGVDGYYAAEPAAANAANKADESPNRDPKSKPQAGLERASAGERDRLFRNQGTSL